MFYLAFAIFCLGAAMLQSSYLRAPKGIVPSRRRIPYTVCAGVATGVEVLVGAAAVLPDPAFIGALLFIPIFYAVNRGLLAISLRLRYTFRIGLALVLLSAYPVIRYTYLVMIHSTW